MTTDDAVRLAEADLSILYASVSATVQGGLAPGERSILCDGSAYSPSWRALSGGGQVWVLDVEGLYSEAYTEALDAGTDDPTRWGAGLALYWEDGCLFVERAREDGEFASSDE